MRYPRKSNGTITFTRNDIVYQRVWDFVLDVSDSLFLSSTCTSTKSRNDIPAVWQAKVVQL